MKAKLEAMLAAKSEQRNQLNASMIEAESKEERSAINEAIGKIDSEIADLRGMIADCDKPQGKLNPIDTIEMNTTEGKREAKGLDSIEYREAFKNFIQKGTEIPAELRTNNNVTTTTTASAVIPTNLVNEIIYEKKEYGELFDEVRHTNFPAGVEFPILSARPVATWISADAGESESDDQKLTANTKITFTAHGLECKLAQTLLVSVEALPAFEDLFVTLAREAMRAALVTAIIKGSGSGQPTGVTVDSRIPEANVISLSAADIASWASWHSKVFAKMKKAYRDGKFYMAQSTFDAYIDGMVDDAGQPIGRVNYGIDNGETYRFGGKIVDTVEESIITGFDAASNGDVIAVFFRPVDYCFNSNLEMTATAWVDNDANMLKQKLLLIGDGKLLDPNGVLVIKKSA